MQGVSGYCTLLCTRAANFSKGTPEWLKEIVVPLHLITGKDEDCAVRC